MLQLKTARLIMTMKDAYSGRQDQENLNLYTLGENHPAASSDGADFAEENEVSEGGKVGTLKRKFVNAKSNTAKLLDLMTKVEKKISKNDVDGAYEFMFHTSGKIKLADKIAKLNDLFDTVKSQGVDVLAPDGLLQIQSTICLLEMLHGFSFNSAALGTGSLDNFLETEDWEGATKLIENTDSFSEAVDFLPGNVGASIRKSLKEEDVAAAEKQLESIQNQLEERLSSLTDEDWSAEANKGEIDFSFELDALIDYIREMVPSGLRAKKAKDV